MYLTEKQNSSVLADLFKHEYYEFKDEKHFEKSRQL